jgi:hypothetical protein
MCNDRESGSSTLVAVREERGFVVPLKAGNVIFHRPTSAKLLGNGLRSHRSARGNFSACATTDTVALLHL